MTPVGIPQILSSAGRSRDCNRRNRDMPNGRPDKADRQAEILDVQLLDVFAQIEALMRLAREIQREALRLRGVPTQVSPAERYGAGQAIRRHLEHMGDEGRGLADVIKQLRKSAKTLEVLLQTESERV